MINYSFIIPHHNSPKLLERCLNSIPQRDDIEIIVVDDNSDKEKKAYSDRRDVRII
jgi:glycosyltransferase involved in cell wall biosynthesis